MKPTQELVDQIYTERVARARRMSVEQKLLAGAELFEMACRMMADGIRNQFPEASEARVQDILTQRLQLLRSLREPE